jgi:quinol monooxygenase YgiN
MYQAVAKVDDFERFKDALEWLHAEIEIPPELVAYRVFRDQQDAARITILEEWTSADAFMAAYQQYSGETREEFGRRAGVDLDAMERSLWELSDARVIVGPAGRPG